MAKIVHPTGQLSGFILPWDLYDATDPNNGLLTDYTEADSEFGQNVTTSNLKVIATGTPFAATTEISTYSTLPGMPDGDACGVLVMDTTGGDFLLSTAIGRNPVPTYTGFKQIIHSTTIAGQQMCALDDGTLVCVFGATVGSNFEFSSTYRDPYTQLWDATPADITSTPTGPLLQPVIGCCTVPDGAVHAYIVTSKDGGQTYSIDCYRSTDKGVQWSLQRTDIDVSRDQSGGRWGPSANPTYNWPVRLRAASGGGSVVLMITGGYFGSVDDDFWTTRQFASTDGGFTFTYVGEGGGGTGTDSIKQRFTEDLQWVGGAYMALFSNANRIRQTAQVFGTANQFAYRDTYLSTDKETVNSDGPSGAGGCIVWDGITNPYVFAKQGLMPYVTTNWGYNWRKVNDSRGVANTATTMGFDYPTCCRCLDKIIIVANLFDDSTSPSQASFVTQAGSLYEIKFSGNTRFNVGPEISGFTNTFLPFQDLVDSGWTLTGTAAPTTISGATGLRFLDSGVANGQYTYAETPAISGGGTGYFHGIVRPVTTGPGGGGASIALNLRTPGAGMSLQITETNYRFFDETVGILPLYVNHGIDTTENYIEFLAIVDSINERATLLMRPYAPETDTYTTWLVTENETSLGANGETDFSYEVRYQPGDEFYVLTLSSNFVTNASRFSGVPGLVSQYMSPIPLSIASPTYTVSGAFLTAQGGPMMRGDIHIVPLTSAYQKANMLPDFAPSPRDYWKSNVPASDMVLTFKPSSGDDLWVGSNTIGIYLTGLKGCSNIDVTLTGFSTSAQLSQNLYHYTICKAKGKTIKIPQATTVSALAPWVEEGELVGGEVILDDVVYSIVANTSGSLACRTTLGNTATITLDRVVDPALGSGELFVYICPPRFLICLTADSLNTTSIDQITLTIPTATPYMTGVNRQIGTAAIGPIRFLGRGVDRKTAFVTDTGREIIDLPNGARSMVERKPNRRRQEIAIVDTAIDVTQIRRISAMADYVVLNSAEDLPAAERYGDPLIFEGLYHEWAGKPIVWLPSIPSTDTNSTTGGPGYARDAIYGRITSESFRREWAGVGKHGQTEMYRVPTLVIEEEI